MAGWAATTLPPPTSTALQPAQGPWPVRAHGTATVTSLPQQCCCGDSPKLNKYMLQEDALLWHGPCPRAATPHGATDHSLARDGTQRSASATSPRATKAPRSLRWFWPPTAAASLPPALTRPCGHRLPQPRTVPSCHHPRPPAPRAGGSVPPPPWPSRTFSAHRCQHRDPSSPRGAAPARSLPGRSPALPHRPALLLRGRAVRRVRPRTAVEMGSPVPPCPGRVLPRGGRSMSPHMLA